MGSSPKLHFAAEIKTTTAAILNVKDFESLSFIFKARNVIEEICRLNNLLNFHPAGNQRLPFLSNVIFLSPALLSNSL